LLCQPIERNLLDVVISVIEKDTVVVNEKRQENQRRHEQAKAENLAVIVFPMDVGLKLCRVLHRMLLSKIGIVNGNPFIVNSL